MNHGNVSPQIAKGLLALKERIAAAKIPSSKLDETLKRHHQPHGSPKSDTKGSPARAVGDKGIHINDTPHVRWMYATRRIGPVDSATPGHRGPVDSRYGAGNGWQT